MPTLALVDDDRNIVASARMALEAEGFDVLTYIDGEEARVGLLQRPMDLVILDVKMPRLDGFELLRKLRDNPATARMPIILLTSKDEEVDEIMGLRMGADDYITKPFSQRLLLERIRALLRRESLRDQPATEPAEPGTLLTRGPLTLDSARHVCLWRGQAVALTVTEFLLVKALAQRPGHVKNRDQLIDAAYGESVCVDDRTIDSHIKRLRKKFRAVDGTFASVETLYGIGYRYREG